MSEITTNEGRENRGQDIAAIEQAAAEWFARCELGLTPALEKEFLRWLEADERHGHAMREMDETWEFLDQLRQLRRPERKPSAVFISMPLTPRRRRRWGFLAAAAAIALSASILWFVSNDRPQDRHTTTGSVGMKKIELADGTVVHLNANSRVRLRFSPTERQVELVQGEAHFAVAKDASRPFVVAAGEVKVKAVGTAFNVRLDLQAVEVLVLEGQVRLNHAATGGSLLGETSRPEPAGSLPENTANPPSAPIAKTNETALLRAGQHALVNLQAVAVSPTAVVRSVGPAELERATAWQSLQLDFDLTPLREVVAQFNRHNSHQLIIADPELGLQLFGGTFRADNSEVFVQLLEQRFGVKAERSADQTVLRRAKP